MIRALLLSLLLLCLTHSVKPPSALCRTTPLPPLIPITVGEQMRFDLEDVFSGYNLFLSAPNQTADHITLNEKYTIKNTQFNQSYNFNSVKLIHNSRFLGLITNQSLTKLIVGTSDDEKGLHIDYTVEVENIANIHCFDMDQLLTHDGNVAIIDCAAMLMGQVLWNQFFYVNLTDKKVVEGRRIHDTFVRYNQVKKRRIQVIEDPFARIPYLVRFHLRDGVNKQFQDQTYVQFFQMNNPLEPMLIDVIDHTFFQMKSLSIADYQIHMNQIYLLIYDKGLYEITFNPDQTIHLRSKFNIQMGFTKFRVDRLGFNDDLRVALTNGHTIYQYQWDVTNEPTLVHKYTLPPNTQVQYITLDFTYVIVVGQTVFGTQLVKRTWIFTRKSNSYLNAYNVFHAPTSSPHLIHWNQHGSILHIFNNYNAYYVRMSLPYVNIKPVEPSMVNKTEEFYVKATSFGQSEKDQVNCTEKFTFIYLMPNDKRIIKTGFWPRNEIYVDTPDSREIPLNFEFFGANLTYNATFQTTTPPKVYVDKQHKAIFNWPKQINHSQISYFQMFTQTTKQTQKPRQIYGLVQTEQPSSNTTVFTTYYIRCDVNVFDQDQVHTLDCKVVIPTRFSMGRILMTSQIYDPRERLLAIVFDSNPNVVYVYFFWPEGFGFFGRKEYHGDPGNIVTGVQIAEKKLFVVLQYSKRVDIFNLEDIYQPGASTSSARPRMVINSDVMRFFGVQYFAPVSIKVSKFHKQVIFLKTKTGVMAININQDFIPQYLFNILTVNIRYDFQINHNNLMIITTSSTSLFQLQLPLRRAAEPLQRQRIAAQFKIDQYDQVCSDKLFYIVGPLSVYVINPRYRSVSAVFSEIWHQDEIVDVDAVNIYDREILFIRTKGEIQAWVFAQQPKMTITWGPQSTDFNMTLTASNPATTSQPYNLMFNILNFNQSVIEPTSQFNQSQVRQMGHLHTPANNATFYGKISLNDSLWFTGTILDYTFTCNSSQNCSNYSKINNHVQVTNDKLLQAKYIYDVQSTSDGIYAQQYYSIFKSYRHNDSIQFINKIPTEHYGEVCTKLAAGQKQQYLVSLCQLGADAGGVRVYITSLVGNKPFTFGPYQTDALEVNFAKIEGDLLMIVDNQDNPLIRAGGVYIYHLNFNPDDQGFISFLDYIDYDDLQIQGFTGTPFIGSADIITPFYDTDEEYRLFLTQTRTGAIFVLGFEVSADGEQLVYHSKKYIPLDKYLPVQLKHPTPLRLHTVSIHFAYPGQNKTVQYYLIITTSNWHHMELMVHMNHNDDILSYKLERLFERFPWKLQNYYKSKHGGYKFDTYFAVPYADFEQSQQVILVYKVPFLLNKQAIQYQDRYEPHVYSLYDGMIPMLSAFGGHYIRSSDETAYAFHTFGNDKIIWVDADGQDLSQITLFPNIQLLIQGSPVQSDTYTITANNPFTNYTFNIDVDFTKDPQPEPEKDKNYLWLGIIGIGIVMILGLLIAYCKQRRGDKNQALKQERLGLSQTLITVERESRIVNRTSVDPGSVRESVQPEMRREEEPKVEKKQSGEAARNEEEDSSESQSEEAVSPNKA